MIATYCYKATYLNSEDQVVDVEILKAEAKDYDEAYDVVYNYAMEKCEEYNLDIGDIVLVDVH